jgi:hypothetical protein
MRLARSIAIAAACVVPLAGAGNAAAAVEAGNSCATNFVATNNAIVQLSRAPGSPLPIAAPISGVITKWRLTDGGTKVYAELLKVLRPTANPKAFQVVGESSYGAVVPGANSFDTRLPVQAGDKFGLFGQEGAIYCQVAPGADVLGFMAGNPTVGSTLTATAESNEFQIPVSVVIEPDADRDGYGDETQDLCPQDPSTHFLCPAIPAPVTLSIAVVPSALKGSAQVLVTASVQASASISATAKLGKGKRVTLRAGTQTVVPGAIARFSLKFSKSLKKHLGELSPKQSLTLKVQTAATTASGQTTTKTTPLKLPGQG